MITTKIKERIRDSGEKIVTLKEKDFLDMLEESRGGVMDNIRAGKEGVYEFSLMVNLIPEVREVIFVRE